MKTFAEFDIEVRENHDRLKTRFEPKTKFRGTLFETIYTINCNDTRLLLKYRSLLDQYYDSISDRVESSEITTHDRLESVLNVLKLKYLRYLQYSESEIKSSLDEIYTLINSCLNLEELALTMRDINVQRLPVMDMLLWKDSSDINGHSWNLNDLFNITLRKIIDNQSEDLDFELLKNQTLNQIKDSL
jgi:hypothetical protein